MVIIVLLKEAFTCATAEVMFFFSLRRGRAALSLTMSSYSPSKTAYGLAGCLLLAGNGNRLALAGAGFGMGALAAHRQALAMAQTAVAAQVHQALDVHRDLAAEVTLDLVIAVDRLADLQHFGIGQLVDPTLGRQADLVADFLRLHRANAIDVGECNHDPLVGR